MAIVRVQVSPAAFGHVVASVTTTLPALPTVGNLLIGCLTNSDNGTPPTGRGVWTGWQVLEGGNDVTGVSDNALAWRKVVQADRDNLGAITVAATPAHPSWDDVIWMCAEYSGVNDVLDTGTVGFFTDFGGSFVMPVLTPAPGQQRLILCSVCQHPNNIPAAPGTWLLAAQGTGGNAQTMQLFEKIVPSTSGSYGGDAIGGVAQWWAPMAAIGGAGGRSMIGGDPGGGFL